MMNRSNSDEAACVPSMMSFVGLEGSNLKQHHLWDWETNSHNSNTTTPHEAPQLPNMTASLLNQATFFAHSTSAPLPTFLDCPAPPLFPMNSFPFYSAQQVAVEYPLALVKREDGAGGRIGLNLGHRTYFSSADAFAIDRLFGRSSSSSSSRAMYSLSHHQPPRCQAEGCKVDLSDAKHYHRRHKVCEFHSKATVVVAAGQQQRFCQQCSRFHVLGEFDEAKRSLQETPGRPQPQEKEASAPSGHQRVLILKERSQQQATEKCKEMQKTNTTAACTSTNISTSISLEGQLSCQGKGNESRNVAALSLGGVGPVEKAGSGSATGYQGGQGPFASVAQGKSSRRQQDNNTFSSAASNSAFFHHHNLCSSGAASQQSTGGGAGSGSGHCTGHHQSGLLHLGQAMFEVDFL